MAKRRRARENPVKTRDKLLIGGGLAVLLGGVVFLVTRPAKASAGGDGGQNQNQNQGQGQGQGKSQEQSISDQAAAQAAAKIAASMAASSARYQAAMNAARAAWETAWYRQGEMNAGPAAFKAAVDAASAVGVTTWDAVQIARTIGLNAPYNRTVYEIDSWQVLAGYEDVAPPPQAQSTESFKPLSQLFGNKGGINQNLQS